MFSDNQVSTTPCLKGKWFFKNFACPAITGRILKILSAVAQGEVLGSYIDSVCQRRPSGMLWSTCPAASGQIKKLVIPVQETIVRTAARTPRGRG